MGEGPPRGRRGGPEGPEVGREPKLPDGDRRRLAALLVRGAAAHGCSTDLWTMKRVAKLIEREFGVRYRFNHVGKLLHAMGFTSQRPRRVAREKGGERKRAWSRTTWARVRKN